ncbi:hypothetical protein HanIR_Chr04g0190571 [Helianthus annuus]|nr:hypothetical protein HanIR_Chr04g0190571 [Helianthus annuus]
MCMRSHQSSSHKYTCITYARDNIDSITYYNIRAKLSTHQFCLSTHLKGDFCLYMYTLQCRTVAKTGRFGPINQTKTDGCLTGLLSGPKRRALAAF